MKIAHIAPPWISIPPKNYGGTEIVIYNIVEEQVAQGHEVTLFAPGDSKTSAKLVSFFPKALIEEGVPWHAHLRAYYHIHKAVEYIKDHGLPMKQFHPTGKPREDFFVWLGRFAPEKGAHLAVEATKRVGVPVVLAGTIDRYSQESMRYFQETIKPLINEKQVKYLGPVNM